jgi:hypothetical protein
MNVTFDAALAQNDQSPRFWDEGRSLSELLCRLYDKEWITAWVLLAATDSPFAVMIHIRDTEIAVMTRCNVERLAIYVELSRPVHSPWV